MRLLLIRHGQSYHAMRHVLAGRRTCPGLTDHGFTQARALAHRLQREGDLQDCHALLSSPVLRARQTAEVLAQTLSIRSVIQDCNLCELHLGQADGPTWHEYTARFGAFDLLTEPSRPIAPEGECWADFLLRVQQTLDYLAAQFAGQTVVAVTHAGFIVAALIQLFAIPRPGTGAQFAPRSAAITELERTGQTWTLVRYNDMAHLPTAT